MKSSRYLMAGLLMLSICLNIYALNRIGALSAAVSNMRSELSRMQDSLDRGLESVYNAVEKIREEAQWVSRVSVTRGCRPPRYSESRAFEECSQPVQEIDEAFQSLHRSLSLSRSITKLRKSSASADFSSMSSR
jgi:hypothetical protein